MIASLFIEYEEVVGMVKDRALASAPLSVRDCFSRHPEAITISVETDQNEMVTGFTLRWDTKRVDELNAKDDLEN